MVAQAKHVTRAANVYEVMERSLIAPVEPGRTHDDYVARRIDYFARTSARAVIANIEAAIARYYEEANKVTIGGSITMR